MNLANPLRREVGHRAQQYAQEHGLPHSLSYGDAPTTCFEPYDGDLRHGNFLAASYKAILIHPNWRRRLQKVHAQGRKSFPQNEHGSRKELDTCASSDALLMNIFCHPRVFHSRQLSLILNLETPSMPEFGFRPRVPLANGKVDRTEVDMRIGDLLTEAKLTENDFQRAPKALVHGYRDFGEVFDAEELPQTDEEYLSYQLIRNILAAYAGDRSFCLLVDARRTDLIEAMYAVLQCVRPVELRLRCRVLAWQELAQGLPRVLRKFLVERYGIQ